MKFGLNMLLWGGALTEEHLPLLAKVKEWGFDGVELPMMGGYEGTPWKAYAKALDDLGMGCTGSSCMFLPGDPTSPDPKARQAAVDHIKGCVDACVESGAESVNGPLFSPLGQTTGKPRTADEWRYSLDTLRQAAEYAQQARVRINLEFLNRFETHFLNCAADAARYVDELRVGNVGVQYDTFHANIEEKNVTKAIQACAHCLGHVHTCENDRSVPGRGQVAWDETFAALKKAEYDRWIVVEAFSSAIPEIAAAACVWRDLFEDAETLAKESASFLRAKWAG